MGKALIYLQMAILTQASTKKESQTVKDSTPGRMDLSILESLEMD